MARDTGFTESDGSEDPIDLSAVRRDDRLVEALIHGGSIRPNSADEEAVAALLSAWRSEIVDAPLPAALDLDAVCAAVADAAADRSEPTAGRRRGSILRPAFGAAAAVAFVVGGVAVVSYNAVPGDPLWQVKQVVFAQEAQSTVARVDTTDALEAAEQLISSGSPQEAKERLDTAAERVSAVADADQRQQLVDWWNRLQAQLLTPSAVPPAPASTSATSTTTTAPATSSATTSTSDSAVTPTLPTELPTELPTFTLPVPLPSLPITIPTEIAGIPVPQLPPSGSSAPTS